MIIANGLVHRPGGFALGGVVIENGIIARVFEGEPPRKPDIDAAGAYIVPGFIDMHVHGGGGANFLYGTEEAFAVAGNMHLRHGTTTLLPTTYCDAPERFPAFMKAYRDYKDDPATPRMPGVHLEHPFFNLEQAGAQSPDYIYPPRPEEYLRWIADYPEILRWDYAPELPGADELLQALLINNIVPSYGHTDADAPQILEAVAKGCRLATHLFSGMAVTRRKNAWRHAGAVEGTYLADDSLAEIIADGCHLPPELIKLTYKIMGPHRVALITDGMSAAGLFCPTEAGAGSEAASAGAPEGCMTDLGGQTVIIEDGVAKTADRQAFAGSIATTDRLIRTAVKAGIPLHDAVTMLTATPAAMLGLTDRGRLDEGLLGDVVVFAGEECNIQHVILGGQEI
ncbi:MAG: amidohydrolase family protein [Clostridia bacterium]|nr:amidohydrolase family protein [Clostridia bacterium]